MKDTALVNMHLLLHEYVARHNFGVKTGDFELLLNVFHEDAELQFINAPLGSITGWSNILEAFQSHPPTDELEILDVTVDSDGVIGRYVWCSQPERVAGRIHVVISSGRIKYLVVIVNPSLLPLEDRLQPGSQN